MLKFSSKTSPFGEEEVVLSDFEAHNESDDNDDEPMTQEVVISTFYVYCTFYFFVEMLNIWTLHPQGISKEVAELQKKYSNKVWTLFVGKDDDPKQVDKRLHLAVCLNCEFFGKSVCIRLKNSKFQNQF